MDPFTLYAIYPKSWVYIALWYQQRKMNFMKDKTECSTRFLREREHSLSIRAEQANFCSVLWPYVRKNPHVGVCVGRGSLEDAGHTGPTDLREESGCTLSTCLCFRNSDCHGIFTLLCWGKTPRDWAAQSSMRNFTLNKAETLEHEIRSVILAMCLEFFCKCELLIFDFLLWKESR